MSPVDAGMMLIESREHPMHVSGLLLVTPPDGVTSTDFARSIYDSFRDVEEIRPVYRRKPGKLFSGFSPISWSDDVEVDLDYHVRLLALPRPGQERELFKLASMLHGTLLDRNRPLWEAYVIEGLESGQVAVFTKTHHALMDGISAVRSWYDSVSTDPDFRGCVPPWQQRAKSEPLPVVESAGFDPMARVGSALRTARNVAGVGPALLGKGVRMVRGGAEAEPFQAPPSIFNVPITGARRIAGRSWPKERFRTISEGAGVSFNDAVLAVCAGAIRRYLTELDELPDEPLIAIVPVSLRGKSDGVSDGNAIGAVLCDLATEVIDPESRLRRVHESMDEAKQVMAGRTPLQIMAVSGINIIGVALQFVPGAAQLAGRPPFNIVISSVPGTSEVHYWNGGRLDTSYPASVTLDNLALNITTISYADELQFGIVGCRSSVPNLHRLVVHLEDALAELEDMIAHDAY